MTMNIYNLAIYIERSNGDNKRTINKISEVSIDNDDITTKTDDITIKTNDTSTHIDEITVTIK